MLTQKKLTINGKTAGRLPAQRTHVGPRSSCTGFRQHVLLSLAARPLPQPLAVTKALPAADVEMRPSSEPRGLDRSSAPAVMEQRYGETRTRDGASTSGRERYSKDGPRRRDQDHLRGDRGGWRNGSESHHQQPRARRQLRLGTKRGPVHDFPYKAGDTVVGKVVSVHNGWRVALECDSDILGYVMVVDLPHVLREDDSEPAWGRTKLGLVREFRIKNVPGDMEYNGKGPLLTARALDLNIIWQRAGQVLAACEQDNESLSVLFNGTNRGGLLATFEGLGVFVPYAYIPQPRSRVKEQEVLADEYCGKRALVSICDMDRKTNRFVGNMIKGMADKAFTHLKVGDVVWGIVHDVEHYGAFITLEAHPAVRGLLHIGSVSRSQIDDLKALFHKDEKVRCIIVGIDAPNYRLNLSTLEIEAESGDMLYNKAKVYEHAEENAAEYRQWVQQRQLEIDEEESFDY